MNGHCSTCAIEPLCAYPYKPCDCVDRKKFIQSISKVGGPVFEIVHVPGGVVLPFPDIRKSRQEDTK